MKRILVIKHGALGDFVTALGACAAIRRHHAGDHVTLLTTSGFADLGRRSRLFDEVMVDDRPARWRLLAWARLARALRARQFDRVYDLQRRPRTAEMWRRMVKGREPGQPHPLEWVGVVEGCSHFTPDPPDDNRHIADKIAEQLALAGITDIPASSVAFLSSGNRPFVAPPFALLVPGSGAKRDIKRAPPTHFQAVAAHLQARGIKPVLIGTRHDADAIDAIAEACPAAVDLCGKTDLGDLADLARHAELAVGNDTGPIFLMAAAGCRTIALFSAVSVPSRSAPRGACVRVLQSPKLDGLPLDRLIAEVDGLLDRRSRT